MKQCFRRVDKRSVCLFFLLLPWRVCSVNTFRIFHFCIKVYVPVVMFEETGKRFWKACPTSQISTSEGCCTGDCANADWSRFDISNRIWNWFFNARKGLLLIFCLIMSFCTLSNCMKITIGYKSLTDLCNSAISPYSTRFNFFLFVLYLQCVSTGDKAKFEFTIIQATVQATESQYCMLNLWKSRAACSLSGAWRETQPVLFGSAVIDSWFQGVDVGVQRQTVRMSLW